jgi:hypothetical protein
MASVYRRRARFSVIGYSIDDRADRGPGPDLLGQAVHDLDPGEIALVNGAVVALAGERLLVDPAGAVTVEEAAIARFELDDAPRGLRHQPPHQLLVVDEAPPRSVSKKWASSESGAPSTAPQAHRRPAA